MTVEAMEYLIRAVVRTRGEVYLSELLDYVGPEGRGDRELVGKADATVIEILLQRNVSPLYIRAFAQAKKYDLKVSYDMLHGGAITGFKASWRRQ